MRLGLSSYTYTWAIGVPGQLPEKRMTVYDLIQKTNDLNVKLVQIADNVPLDKFTNDERCNLLMLAKLLGISFEIGSKGLTAQHTFNYIKLAEEFKSPLLRMVIDGPEYKPSINDVIGIIADLLPELKSRNIKLALENHDRLKAREFEYIIQKTGSEYVGICLDSVNSMGAGEGFETVCDILLPYTINLHVKDFQIQRLSHKMGFSIEGAPAGKGMLNIPSLLEKADMKGLCKSAIIELWTPYKTSLTETIALEANWAIESVGFLKQFCNNTP